MKLNPDTKNKVGALVICVLVLVVLPTALFIAGTGVNGLSIFVVPVMGSMPCALLATFLWFTPHTLTPAQITLKKRHQLIAFLSSLPIVIGVVYVKIRGGASLTDWGAIYYDIIRCMMTIPYTIYLPLRIAARIKMRSAGKA